MFDFEFGDFIDIPSPPTSEDIERNRQKQLDAIKEIQQKLVDVIESGISAA